jgi:hypothetical protein
MRGAAACVRVPGRSTRMHRAGRPPGGAAACGLHGRGCTRARYQLQTQTRLEGGRRGDGGAPGAHGGTDLTCSIDGMRFEHACASPRVSQVAVDIAHHKTMFELHQRVAPSEVIVGWWVHGAASPMRHGSACRFSSSGAWAADAAAAHAR